MRNDVMKEWLESSYLAGANATYVEELYELYLDDPEEVDPRWRELFDQLPRVKGHLVEKPHSKIRDNYRNLATPARQPVTGQPGGDERQARVMQLINAYRLRGHLRANLDPLGWKLLQ